MARRLTQADQGGTFGEFRGGGDGGEIGKRNLEEEEDDGVEEEI